MCVRSVLCFYCGCRNCSFVFTVPRYENAAKSNYWTMTSEGFEEFGNENSFKRRRRRGATLAPISAYKNKKGNANNESKLACWAWPTQELKPVKFHFVCLDNRVKPRETMDSIQARDKKLVWHSRSHTPEPRMDYQPAINSSNKALKRPYSPNSDQQNGSKNQRMMVLKHGEGPSLGKQNCFVFIYTAYIAYTVKSSYWRPSKQIT